MTVNPLSVADSVAQKILYTVINRCKSTYKKNIIIAYIYTPIPEIRYILYMMVNKT